MPKNKPCLCLLSSWDQKGAEYRAEIAVGFVLFEGGFLIDVFSISYFKLKGLFRKNIEAKGIGNLRK